MSNGLTALDEILATLTVGRTGRFVYAVVDRVPEGLDVFATVREAEGLTVIFRADQAVEFGLPDEPVFECLTLEVHSALESVGLTQAVSTVLADARIACNVIAGYHHDHLLVPTDRADEAEQLLLALRRRVLP